MLWVNDDTHDQTNTSICVKLHVYDILKWIEEVPSPFLEGESKRRGLNPYSSMVKMMLHVSLLIFQFRGLWYVIASNYQRPIKPPVVIRIAQNEGELFYMRAIIQLPWVYLLINLYCTSNIPLSDSSDFLHMVFGGYLKERYENWCFSMWLSLLTNFLVLYNIL